MLFIHLYLLTRRIYEESQGIKPMLKNKGHYKCMHSSCRYMEEVIESTFSLLSSNHDHCSQRAEKTLEPVHLLALLDIEATWFKKWMVRPFVFSTSSLPVSFCFRLLWSLLVFFPLLSPPFSTDTTAGRWFSDSSRESTSLW